MIIIDTLISLLKIQSESFICSINFARAIENHKIFEKQLASK